MSYPCVCTSPGICPRHNVHKTKRDIEICQGINCTPEVSAKYKKFWDDRASVQVKLPATVTESPRPSVPVTVGILCHNYGRFLTECISSVRGQDYPNIELFVVDDASTDDTAQVCTDLGVRRIAVDYRNVHLTRKRVYEEATGEVICFLDADDTIPPTYVSQGVALFKEPTVGIVYSDVQKFGTSVAFSSYPEFDRHQLFRQNYIHAGSLVLKSALRLSGAFESVRSDCPGHADWLLWKRVIRCGYIAKKQSSVYQYRQHGLNMLAQVTASYPERANLHEEPITIFTPLSGRKQHWKRFSEQLEVIAKNAEQPVSVLLLDTSQDHEFSQKVRQWISVSGLRDIRHVVSSLTTPGIVDLDRQSLDTANAIRRNCARIYNWLRQNLLTEYVLTLEDDVFPHEPKTLIRDLLDSFDERTDSVSATYLSRTAPEERFVAWRNVGGMISEEWRGEGVETVSGTGFGCLMIRRQSLNKIMMQDTGSQFLGSMNADFDLAFFDQLAKSGGVSKLDWDTLCDHDTKILDAAVTPLPKSDWPLYAKIIAKHRTEQDVGVGDTIKRNLGRPGGMFEIAFKTLTGKSCGCGKRKKTLNARYPYSEL